MNTSQSLQNIGIASKPTVNVESIQCVKKVIDFMLSKGKKLYIDQQSCGQLQTEFPNQTFSSLHEIACQCDLAFIIGGDGSLLHASKYFVDHNTPLSGINLGRLGYLTDIPAKHMLELIAQIFDYRFITDQRLMLIVQVQRNNEIVYQELALNEFNIAKLSTSSMIGFSTSINGKFLQSQRSDGMIISTPTGSTAYALSLGGPILDPSLDCFNLIAVNPHSLTYRPLVISANSIIEVNSTSTTTNYATVLCDGRMPFQLNGSDKIIIQKYAKKLTLIHPINYDKYKILRTKLSWSTEL